MSSDDDKFDFAAEGRLLFPFSSQPLGTNRGSES